MTLADYRLHIKAARLKRADALQLAAQMALFHRAVEAYDPKKKKYVIKDARQLIDIEKIEREVLGLDKSMSREEDRLARRRLQIANNLKQYREELIEHGERS